MGTIKREALYFFALFVVPCVGLIVLGWAWAPPSAAGASCILEDTCAYASCFILPGLLWGLSRGFVLVASLLEGRGR